MLPGSTREMTAPRAERLDMFLVNTPAPAQSLSEASSIPACFSAGVGLLVLHSLFGEHFRTLTQKDNVFYKKSYKKRRDICPPRMASS